MLYIFVLLLWSSIEFSFCWCNGFCFKILTLFIVVCLQHSFEAAFLGCQ